MILVRAAAQGLGEGSASKGACHQAWQPELDPGGRRERTREQCPLTSTHTLEAHAVALRLYFNK